MKRIYWRPSDVSRRVMVLLCLISLGGLFVVERFRSRILQPHYEAKTAAARLAEKCFAALKAERLRRDIPIDPETDPAQTGLVGTGASPVTSSAGVLPAKRTTLNPNFAAVLVALLKQCGLKEGDLVAVGCTGSFPALNVCVLAAAETLKLQPIIISSASSSQWGANHRNFLWLDMEKMLFEAGLIHWRSVAASVGGIEDRGLGMTREGIKLLADAIAAHGLTYIAPKDHADSVRQHMEIYRKHAGGRRIKALVNVGGLATALGRLTGKKEFKSGVNRVVPPGVVDKDSIMATFIRQDRAAVVNLLGIEKLARTYGLPFDPQTTPIVGKGGIFATEGYNQFLAAGALLMILATLWVFVRTDVGFRFLQSFRSKGRGGHPEPMI